MQRIRLALVEGEGGQSSVKKVNSPICAVYGMIVETFNCLVQAIIAQCGLTSDKSITQLQELILNNMSIMPYNIQLFRYAQEP